MDIGVFEEALGALQHRGPDHRGTWEGDGVILGHTRLAVIDLEGGNQPLRTADNDLVLVANGEFYDHDRHLEALASRGHQLGSRSDSEVVLHFYREMGVGCLSLLRGEFAFCLWDAKRKRLFAARDRFGIKPLFYGRHEGRLYIASEAKALWAAGFPAAWDEEGVHQSLHLCRHQDRTLFRGVYQLPPGHFLVADDRGLEVTAYWDQSYPRRLSRVTPGEAVDEVSRLLHEAVRLRTRSDVPLACYLSGGVDSSSVLGLAQRYSRGQVTAFSVAFEDPQYDESSVAREMAGFAGADFHEVRVSGADLAEAFESTVIQGENVVYNGHAPARWLLSQALQERGFKVALGGEGADELFAGYHFSQRALTGSSQPWWRTLGRFLQPARRDLREVSWTLEVAVRGLGLPDDVVGFLSEKFLAARQMICPAFLARFQGRDVYREFLSQFPWLRLWGAQRVSQVLYVWMHSAFLNYVLAAERLDMAHAVELRLPFLDHRLFEYTKTLPARLLYYQNQNKYLLRQAVAPYVSPQVLRGDKQPFLAPPAQDTPLSGKLHELLRSPELRDIPFLEEAKVLDFFDSLKTEERSAYDPLLSYLASLVVLHSRYRLS